MAIGRVGTEHDHAISEVDTVEVLRAGRFSERCFQAIAGRRVADARTGVDIVVAKTGADQLLDKERLFVGAARTGDATGRRLTILRLDALDLGRRVFECFFPRHFAPWVGDLLADHRLLDAIGVRCIPPREATLDATVTVVRLTVLVRHHANDFAALHLGAERATDTAVGAGGRDRVVGLAFIDDRLLHQRRCRARLHAGTARHAFGIKEVGRAGSDLRIKAATFDGQCERALRFFASAHAP